LAIEAMSPIRKVLYLSEILPKRVIRALQSRNALEEFNDKGRARREGFIARRLLRW
jgi:hypothetical protein